MESSASIPADASATSDSRSGPRAASPVFLAKLRPPSSAHLLRRSRLLDLLDDALRGPIVVVAAPAGSGKTSLLASWAAERDHTVAWLSLDEWDRDPARLWAGILAAIETIAPHAATRARALLSQRRPFDEVLATLLVDLESAPMDEAILVLDDVHLVDDVHGAVRSIADLASYLPVGFHLVLIGRRRLPLPTDRLRAQGRLREVSFEELQFSAEEAAQMLATLAPGLTAGDIRPTTDRAAGWAASIQLSGLAARSAQARSEEHDPTDSDRLTEDYLWHEVLAHESPDTIAILHAASIVERVNGDLARAISEREDAEGLLEHAVERGLFLMRLSKPGWYTQHALVRELLQRELGARSPGALSAMHARAARWYEESGEPSLAVKHWLKSAQPRDALRTVAVNSGTLYDQGQESVINQAISQMPADLVAQDLAAAVDYAWVHVMVDRRVLLDTVDQIVELSAGQDLDARTRGRLLILQSVASAHRGDWGDTGDQARAALAQFGSSWPSDHLGQIGWNLVAREVALSERWSDDAPQVRRAARMLEVDHRRRTAFEGVRALGLALNGRPTQALSVVGSMLETANLATMSILSLELFLASGIALRERGERDRAMAQLGALAQRPLTPLPYVPLRAALELAEGHLAAGHLDEAEARLASARQMMTADLAGAGASTWADTVETLVAIGGGMHVRAEAAAQRIADPVWAAIGLSRVRLAQHEPAAALAALEGVRPRSVRQQVIVDLLRSRSTSTQADSVKAMRRAAQLAAEHNLMQTVAAEGIKDGQVWERLERVADAVPAWWLDQLRRSSVTSPMSTDHLPAGAQSLTERERDVLRMLPSRLTVSEIADELHLSTNTVKFHLKIIYRKLGCSSRAEAAAVARALTRIDRTGQTA